MPKKITIFILFLIPLYASASSGKDSLSLKQRIQETKIAKKTHNIVDRIIDRYTSNNATDTLYAVKNDYRLQVRPTLTEFIGVTNFSWNASSEMLPGDCSIYSDPMTKVGITLGYRCLSIGYDVDISLFNPKEPMLNKEFNLSFYGQMLGIDFSLNKAKNHSFEFKDEETKLTSNLLDSKRWQLNTYYVFNRRRFSYPAAITQSYVQNKSAGSPLVGFSLYSVRMHDAGIVLPEEMVESLGEYQFPKTIEYVSVNLNAGYAHNFVTSHRHVLLHISLMPDISLYRKSKVDPHPLPNMERGRYVSFGGLGRFSCLWQRENHYFGLVAVITAHTMTSYKEIFAYDEYGRISLFYGFRAYRYKR